MIVRKKRKSDNFTVLENTTINANLSWASRGLLVYLLSKPENWQISVNQLMKVTEGTAKKTGRDGLYAMIDELVSLGFIERGERIRNKRGQLAGFSYTVFEAPSTPEPYTGEPTTANPHLIKNITNKRINNTKAVSEETAPEYKYFKTITSLWNSIMTTQPKVDLNAKTQAAKTRVALINKIARDYPDYKNPEYFKNYFTELATCPDYAWQRENKQLGFDQATNLNKFARNRESMLKKYNMEATA
jgi:hypothetical protein